MDVAYDHVQEEALSPASPERSTAQLSTSTNPTDPQAASNEDPQPPGPPDLNTELRTAFKNIQATQWGSTLGGWFSTARKQGESFYTELQKEAADASEQATKGFSSLKEQVVNRTRSLSLELGGDGGEASSQSREAGSGGELTAVAEAKEQADAARAEAEALQSGGEGGIGVSGADIVKEAGTLVASLRSTAASKLKDLQKAEDAADEALLKFGANVRDFLRDAVTISAPDDAMKGAESEVLFETQEPGTGKKVVHATRLDALLHAVHTTPASFTSDPHTGDGEAGNEKWTLWSSEFDIDSKTTEIATDLDKYEELRRAMEKHVPETVEYKAFWMRYYFLRQAIEEEERRRREVLKGATTTGEEVSWDEESEDEADQARTPNPPTGVNPAASASTTTLNAPAVSTTTTDSLKPNSPRRSNEDESRSVADSDTSYDIVSGATSRAPGSEVGDARKGEESDDDWE